jgi:hypothetical protein
MDQDLAEDIDVLVEWALALTGCALIVAGVWAATGWRSWAINTGFGMTVIAAYRIGRLAERRIERARRSSADMDGA